MPNQLSADEKPAIPPFLAVYLAEVDLRHGLGGKEINKGFSNAGFVPVRSKEYLNGRRCIICSQVNRKCECPS